MTNFVIIIPCYNEEKRLKTNDFLSFIKENLDFILFFINDGSKDNTQAILNQLADSNPEQCLSLELKNNVGKGEAIRQAINYLKNNHDFKYVGYLDADLSTPLQEMKRLYSLASKEKLLMAFGSRVKLLGNNIERSSRRHYLGRVFATIASRLIGLPIYDTQCGAKVFHSSIVNDLYAKPFLSKWIFDVEIFIRYNKLFEIAKAKEIILEDWSEVGGSKIKLIDFLRIPNELLRIYLKGER